MPYYKNISALCSVFKDTDPRELGLSINSIITQSFPPKEILIIIDGKITHQIEDMINNFRKVFNIRTFKLKENKGLGNALNFGLRKCNYNVVARFDTDDISLRDRFKKQIEFINCGWDLVSSSVIEYKKNLNNNKFSNLYVKSLSKKNIEITKEELILRNPINHPSVMINVKKVINSGINYKSKMKKHQDFLLWRELKFNEEINFKMIHIAEVTVIMRSNKLIKNRSSIKSLFFEFLLFYYSINISKKIYLKFKILLSFIIRLLIIYISPLIYNRIRTKYTLTEANKNLKSDKEIEKILTNF